MTRPHRPGELIWTTHADDKFRHLRVTLGLSMQACANELGIALHTAQRRARILSLAPQDARRLVRLPAVPVALAEMSGSHTLPALASLRAVTMRAPSPVPIRHAEACCWPIGEPGRAGFRMCEAVPARGRSYCVEHCRVAYVPRVMDEGVRA